MPPGGHGCLQHTANQGYPVHLAAPSKLQQLSELIVEAGVYAQGPLTVGHDQSKVCVLIQPLTLSTRTVLY